MPRRPRSRHDHLYAAPLGSREREALSMIVDKPGITVAELQDALGVGSSRVWQIVGRLQRPTVRLDARPDPGWPAGASQEPA